ncbi:MAG: hypothetical protein AB7W59_02285 [Acidimicrobiia bacterium]
MAVDLYIGSVETVIESSGAGGTERERDYTMLLARLRADLAREQVDAERRARDQAAEPRSFGLRH